MPYHKLYYSLKPYLPRAIRLAARRAVAQRKRRVSGQVWPINSDSNKKPTGWAGWPDGKKFAVVLTHDIESAKGLERCRRLAEMEVKLGFRSSFNFIPEGDYLVSEKLRKDLARDGFEVGIHDLKHDGKLYSSKEAFKERALRINRYLNEWNASGFRSGFMHHNLDWLHNLDIQYDSSTFDTDPFEPQPDGANTIFPFWVSNPKNSNANAERGYVELPYTLPQDSTLFILFQEQNIDIWKKKLDWVAANGGMVLLNTHPDYMTFENEQKSSVEYPIAFYQEFLEYLLSKYQGQFWHALPKTVAKHISQLRPLPVNRRPLRVCMITHSHYARDNRVIRYAEALAARGDEVDVFGLRPTPESPDHERIGDVNVFCLQDRFAKKGKHALGYLFPLLRFFFRSSFWIMRRQGQHPYDVCHIHNIPDFLVFAAWYPRLRGAKLILDIHDVVPEFFASKFSKREQIKLARSLLLMERWSARFAHRVIIANDLWLEKYATRTGANGKCSVFINNVDTKIFRPRSRTRNDGKFIMIFPGGLQWHQGLDIAIRAFHKVAAQMPHAEFHIYGDGNMKESLVALTIELGLSEKVRFFKPLPVREVAEIMANADVGVVPKRADSFGNEAYSTKIMEFMALGVPVIVSNTKIDQYYFNDTVVKFFESGNEDALTRAILDIREKDSRETLIRNANAYVQRNSWETRSRDYLSLVDSLALDSNLRRS
jgi:glycosyltransferase involved in cell wall biosynthesis